MNRFLTKGHIDNLRAIFRSKRAIFPLCPAGVAVLAVPFPPPSVVCFQAFRVELVTVTAIG